LTILNILIKGNISASGKKDLINVPSSIRFFWQLAHNEMVYYCHQLVWSVELNAF